MTSDALFRTLAQRLAGEVHTDDGWRAAYSADASNHRVVPAGVVLPRHVDDVVATVRLCADAEVPLTLRGAGTSVAGNAIGPGVVLDVSRHLDRVLSVDPDEKTAVVEPGVVLDDLQRQAGRHRLRLGPDPSTHNRCTIGGMIGNNACGSHSVAWGTTADSVRALDLVAGDATVRRVDGSDTPWTGPLTRLRDDALAPIRQELGRFGRQMSGYALQHLLPEHGLDVARALVGSEGTCGVVTAATVRLVDLPAHRALVVAGFVDDVAAAAAAPTLVRASPLTLEGIDHNLVRAFDTRPGPHSRPELPPGRAWLLVEVAGAGPGTGPNAGPGFVRARADVVAQIARAAGALGTVVLTDPAEQRAFWSIRERGAGLATRTAEGGEAWPGWEDSAVPPERLARYLRDFRELLGQHGRQGVVYGHFGEGCVHVRIDHDLLSAPGRAAYRAFQEEAADLVVRHHGSLSGEHGDGRARGELLAKMYSPQLLAAFAGFKRVFDPAGVFNPGVLVAPEPLDAGLRLQVNRPHTVDLAFGYHDDDGDFGKAMRRCVGVGACRKESGGGMCPSYRATRDERHSTRGRARVLFEMLDGHLADDGWRSADVRDALDLCLACKACSSECPVSVDMATYKAEFLHQHYRRRLRPRSHYSMGWLPLWLRFARRVPRLANAALAHLPLARLGGLDRNREIPRLASRPARPARRSRRTTGRAGAAATGDSAGGAPVVLWVDTFTASFGPEIARDAVTVLRAAGLAVTVVGPDVCCGLTWLSTGQLGVARRVMRRAVDALAATTGPVVVLEPSCAAALRTDAPELLQSPEATATATRIRTLAEVLREHPVDLAPLDAAAVAQFHCHQRAVFGTDADRELLARLGVDLTSVDEGCCGLAGNFGFEQGHYDISVTCAEQSFLPAVRGAPESTLLADGFSCRLQIDQLAGRQPLHLAQLLAGQLRR